MPARKVTAYQRFHNLTSPVDHAIALPLPYTYKMLGQVFGAADTLVAMQYNLYSSIRVLIYSNCLTANKVD